MTEVHAVSVISLMSRTWIVTLGNRREVSVEVNTDHICHKAILTLTTFPLIITKNLLAVHISKGDNVSKESVSSI